MIRMTWFLITLVCPCLKIRVGWLLIVKQGGTREIRILWFLIFKQGVIGGDKDFRKKSVGSLSLNREWRDFCEIFGRFLIF